MEDVIDGYRPDLVPAEHWAIIGPFVQAILTDSAFATPTQARLMASAVARHVYWCWQQGYPLDRNVVFRREVIAASVAAGSVGPSPRTQGSLRSRLLRLSETFVDGPHRHPRIPAIPAADAQAPYSDREVTLLRSWAANQNTTYREVNATMILALGLGAGLVAREMAGVTAADVTIDDDGVLIAVTAGARPRTVPVLAAWEDTIASVTSASMRPDLWLVLPRRRLAYHRNLLPNFTLDTINRPVSVNAGRLRATWLVRHLRVGTPVNVLADAAGLASPAALAPYLAFVPGLDTAEARRLLRAQVKATP